MNAEGKQKVHGISHQRTFLNEIHGLKLSHPTQKAAIIMENNIEEMLKHICRLTLLPIKILYQSV